MLALLLACTAAAPPSELPSETADTALEEEDTADTASPDQDLSEAGPHPVNATSQSVTASCEIELERFTPEEVTNPPLVILSHGFARDRKNMVEMGEHLATWGFDVAVPTLCNLGFTNTDHPQNGIDLVTLAEALGGSPLYVGYSAGGLASALAANQDSSARGLVGLDPVDSEDLGLTVAGSVPQLGLFSESSACNASNNGVPWFQTGEALRVTDANHCDFEGPTDQLCTLVCASGSSSPGPRRQEVVGAMTTAAGLGLNGDTQIRADWWHPAGERYEAFHSQGRISEP
jgi:pimeloyl-ACP methyl ester carboxylesterase